MLCEVLEMKKAKRFKYPFMSHLQFGRIMSRPKMQPFKKLVIKKQWLTLILEK